MAPASSWRFALASLFAAAAATAALGAGSLAQGAVSADLPGGEEQCEDEEVGLLSTRRQLQRVAAHISAPPPDGDVRGGKVAACLKTRLPAHVDWLQAPRYRFEDIGSSEGPWLTVGRKQAEQNASQQPRHLRIPEKNLPLWYLHNPRVADEMEPTAVVYPQSVDDVQIAVQCANEAGLEVAGQCGRNSYVAYCKKDCVLINVYLLKSHEVDSSKKVAKLGAGLNLGQAYTYLDDAGFTIPGGTVPTVGLAGLTLGGGKGIMTRTAGLLIDKLRGVEVVLKNGTFVKADENNEPDLLWLAKGGGGNSFPGIVTAFHFELVERPEIITEWTAKWDMVCQGAGCGETGDLNATPAVDAWELWQDEYLNHPNRNVYVRIELHSYWENGQPPYVSFACKFIGMTQEEAEPYVLPAIQKLGKPGNSDGSSSKSGGSWSSNSWIKSVQLGGGIGKDGKGGQCKTWDEGLTESGAREQMLRAVPPFCTWDSGFDQAIKHRALVMKKLGRAAIRKFMRTVLQAPYFEPQGNHPWWFYLQADPVTGFAGDVPADETAYPWRGQDEMTLQVLAKWEMGIQPFTLQAFNRLIISTLQPFAGTRSYYNYLDEDMPGGAIPVFSYFGPNAAKVWATIGKYGGMREDGTEWILEPTREDEFYSMQERQIPDRLTDAYKKSLKNATTETEQPPHTYSFGKGYGR